VGSELAMRVVEGKSHTSCSHFWCGIVACCGLWYNYL